MKYKFITALLCISIMSLTACGNTEVATGTSTDKAISDSSNGGYFEYDTSEWNESWDPDVHCTYDGKLATPDNEMLIALSRYSVPYKNMSSDDINFILGARLAMYFEGAFTKSQWSDHLINNYDLSSLENAYLDKKYGAETKTEISQDDVDFMNRLTGNAESELGSTVITGDESEELLMQWLGIQDQGNNNGSTQTPSNNGGSSNNGSGNSNSGGGSSNQGGSSNNENVDEYGNAPWPGGDHSIDIDPSNPNIGDIGTGQIGNQ